MLDSIQQLVLKCKLWCNATEEQQHQRIDHRASRSMGRMGSPERPERTTKMKCRNSSTMTSWHHTLVVTGATQPEKLSRLSIWIMMDMWIGMNSLSIWNGQEMLIQTSRQLKNYGFWFQTDHSTDHAVIQLVDEILKSFDKKLFTFHNILIKKLELYGIKNNNINFFKNYLSNRKQSFSFNNTYSQLKSIVRGVPQGSTLGKLLFLFYVNDLYLSSKLLHLILFTDVFS